VILLGVRKIADSDFFLALMKDSDWLKKRALEIYGGNGGNIYVTALTVAELMIVCKREGIDLRQVCIQVSRIAKLDGLCWEDVFRACDFVEKGATIFDSFVMASCRDGDSIISSDKVYGKFGFDVIDLRG